MHRRNRESLGKTPDEQFKRATSHIRAHLTKAITAYLAPQLPPLPPAFWGWADAIIWQRHTPEQRTALTEMGYVINMASRNGHTTPFESPLPVRLGRDAFTIRPTLPPHPDVVHVPLLTDESLERVAARGTGHYTPTFTLSEYWAAINEQLCPHYDAPNTDRPGEPAPTPAPPPDALRPWLAQLKLLNRQALAYYHAYHVVVDLLWYNIRSNGETRHGSCNTYLLTVPEWVPASVLPSNRRTALPRKTRDRIEARMEAILRETCPGDGSLNRCDPGMTTTPWELLFAEPDAPLLPQLRAFLLPALTAYRLTGDR